MGEQPPQDRQHNLPVPPHSGRSKVINPRVPEGLQGSPLGSPGWRYLWPWQWLPVHGRPGVFHGRNLQNHAGQVVPKRLPGAKLTMCMFLLRCCHRLPRLTEPYVVARQLDTLQLTLCR